MAQTPVDREPSPARGTVLVVAPKGILGEALAAVLAAGGLAVRLAEPPGVAAASPRAAAAVVVAPPGPGDDAVPGAVAALHQSGARVAVLGPGSGPGTLSACLESGAGLLIPWGATLEQFIDAVATLAGGRSASLPRDRVPARDESARARAAREMLESLTARERAVLADLVAGRRAAAIARSSYVSLHTIRSQIRSILDKLDVHSQLEAVALARRAGWPGE